MTDGDWVSDDGMTWREALAGEMENPEIRRMTVRNGQVNRVWLTAADHRALAEAFGP